MAFSDFENIIEVVIGDGWIPGKVHFAEDDVIFLMLASENATSKIYTENGTADAGPNNRIMVMFTNQVPGTSTNMAAILVQKYATTSSWISLAAINFMTVGTDSNYTFKDLFTQTSLAYNFLKTTTAYIYSGTSFYNPNIFKAMITYGGYIDAIEEGMTMSDSGIPIPNLYNEIDDAFDLDTYLTYSPGYEVIEEEADLSDILIFAWKDLIQEAMNLGDTVTGIKIVYLTDEESMVLTESVLGIKALNFLNTDQIAFAELLRWGWGQNIAESLSLTETLSSIIGKLLREQLSLSEVVSSMFKGMHTILESLVLTDTSKLVELFNNVIADGMSATDAIKIGINFLVADTITLTCAISNIGKFLQSISDGTTLTDLSKLSWERLIEDSMDLADSLTVTYLAIVAISEAFSLADSGTISLISRKTISENLSMADAITMKSILSDIINDGFGFDIEIVVDDEVWECWVVNTNAFNVSVYSGFDFNSYCVFNGDAYAANSSGIFKLSGTTDNGSAFKSGVVFPETYFGIANNKKFRRAHFGISGTAPSIKIETDSGSATYSISSAKANISRNLKGKTWTLTLQDFDSLDFIELIPIILTR